MNKHGNLLIETIVNGPLAENCYLLIDEKTHEALLVDPGCEDEKIFSLIQRTGAQVKQIVGTHAHVDHLGAVVPLNRRLQVPVALHEQDQKWLKLLIAQAEMLGLGPVEIPVVDRNLKHGDEISFGQRRAKVLHTPGHSSGGLCLHFSEEKVVITGDTLFAGAIGRTDLPGGSTEQIITSIKSQLFTLPDETVVYPGHGPSTTIATERRENIFC